MRIVLIMPSVSMSKIGAVNILETKSMMGHMFLTGCLWLVCWCYMAWECCYT